MDYATQSSRVGARVPYSLLSKVLLRSYILPLRGGVTWHSQLVCPWHLARYLVGIVLRPVVLPTIH